VRIYTTGKIAEGFYVTGFSAVPVYLLDAPEPVLFDAGWSFIARLYERDIREVLGERRPAHLFLSHSHFDHLGAASFFKRVWPDIKIGGSPRIPEILARPGAVQLIRDLSREDLDLLLS